MSDPGDFCIASNPDISGIGVRTAIYAQNLLSFIPAISALMDAKVTPAELETLEAQSMTILITAFAILVSAIVQAPTLGLTNFHATIILNLSWINNTNTFIYFLLYCHHLTGLRVQRERATSGKSLNRGGTSDWVSQTKLALRKEVIIIGSLHLSLMAAVGIWLWRQPAAFGHSPRCSVSASVVILGGKVSLASKGLRAWSLAIYALLLIPGLNLVAPISFLIIPYFIYDRVTSRSSLDEISIIPIASGLALLAMINIIFLVDTEVTIKRNMHLLENGDTSWTFGQTLALLLLLLPIRDITETVHGRRPKQLGKKLLVAVVEGKFDIVKDLVERGADMNVKDNGGETALRLAAMQQRLDVVEFLVKHYPDVNAKSPQGQTALMHAAEKQGRDVVKVLIEKKADVHMKDKDGTTALLGAASHGHLDNARLLIEHGADVNMKNQRGNAPLQFAAYEGNLGVVELLVEHQADVNVKNQWGETPLLFAAKNGHLDVIRLLVKHRAEVNSSDEQGSSALLLAASEGHFDVVSLLVDHVVDINAINKRGSTALLLATPKGHLEIARLLVERGADVNLKDSSGSSALQLAVRKGHHKITKCLSEKGAEW